MQIRVVLRTENAFAFDPCGDNNTLKRCLMFTINSRFYLCIIDAACII